MALKTFAILVLVGTLAAVPRQVPDREQHWNQDLMLFASEFPSHQRDFEKLYSRSTFDGEVASLRTDLSRLTDAQIILRLMHMVASANVAHTQVYVPLGSGLFRKLGFVPIPLQTAWYSDGLGVVGATSEYAEHLGTHVVKIGTLTPEEVLARVAPYISHENDAWLREQSPALLQMWSVLQQIGAVRAGDALRLTLAKAGGEPYVIDIPPDATSQKRVSMYDVLPIPVSLSRKQRDLKYWDEWLPDSGTLYIQYNECTNDPKLPFDKFAADLLTTADSMDVKRVAIDLRFNGGGDSRIINSLIRGIQSRNKLRSHLYVLIGPGTFSSAQLNAMDLHDKLGAILVGQATGEKLNSYGEIKTLTLPNSGLRVQYTTKFFNLVPGSNSALEPVVTIPFALEDALAGRDRVLDYVLSQ